ncbi:hypothetical protein ACFL2Z_05650 [Candidatus Eisenbacteria bacterium]|uniref:Right handed beta helix domain-containing protein n=1 Tax=Eiseniibacteriota bacterium TaxID=2212470 RepID=A0ABV6YQQ6_UNCEI
MGRMVFVYALVVLVFTSVSLATTWYVKDDGTGDVPTIQAAVDSVAPGDTVMLASGTFTGAGNHNIVVSEDGFLMCSETGNPEDCVIDFEGHLGPSRWGFDFLSSWGPQTYIRGITMRNANRNEPGSAFDAGGAIRCMGSLTIRDCVFESNVAALGGGAIELHEAGDRFVSKNCSFTSNEVSSSPGLGGAILIVGSGYLEVMIDSCTFYGNQAVAGGAIHFPYHEVMADILNCLFIENSALSHGGGIVVESINDAWVENCTFYANHAPTGSAISTWTTSFGYSRTDVRSCIIAYGTGGEGYYQSDWVPDDRSMQCTNIYGNEGGDWVGMLALRRDVDGNFRAKPEFCNIMMEPYDLSLCDLSPCLPGNHPAGYNCGLIGAFGQGCICEPTRTESTTWGGIKSLYR